MSLCKQAAFSAVSRVPFRLNPQFLPVHITTSPILSVIQDEFVDKTPYTIMFGPDKCGEDYKLHFIFRHKNPKTGEYEEKHAKKPDSDLRTYYTDKKTHLYTLGKIYRLFLPWLRIYCCFDCSSYIYCCAVISSLVSE